MWIQLYYICQNQQLLLLLLGRVFIISSSSLGAKDHIPLKQLCSLLHSPRPPIKACNKQRSTYTSKRVILPKVINAWLINQMHFKAGSWKHSRTCNLAEPRCLGPWFRVCSPSTTPLMKRPVPVTGCRLVLSGFDMFSCNIQSLPAFWL